jgi:hypothetical protein
MWMKAPAFDGRSLPRISIGLALVLKVKHARG